MFTVRPYKEEDAAACGDCFYEGFFSCSVDQNDKILLRDYAQILIEKCNFTYVAETEDHQVVGFICGKYDKRFSKALADYIRLIRLKRAAQLLKEQKYSITEVAEMTGFSDAKYFREVFKKHFSVSPSQYAKQKEEGE